MKAVRVHLSDGSSYVTSVNGAVSDEEISRYFVGQTFHSGEQEIPLKCTKIEKV